MRLPTCLAALRRDSEGAMAIETALVMPFLLMLTMGSYQVSNVVARQVELQSAIAEASQIAIASPPDTQAKLDVLKAVVSSSSKLSGSNVTVANAYRCGTDATFVTTKTSCGSKTVSDYVKIELKDTYVPAWTKWGLGSTMNFDVVRYVMVKQEAS